MEGNVGTIKETLLERVGQLTDVTGLASMFNDLKWVVLLVTCFDRETRYARRVEVEKLEIEVSNETYLIKELLARGEW